MTHDPAKPRTCDVRFGTVGNPLFDEVVPMIELSAYDALVKRCETAEESERFYRREWESACERVSYREEEHDALLVHAHALAEALADIDNLEQSQKNHSLWAGFSVGRAKRALEIWRKFRGGDE